VLHPAQFCGTLTKLCASDGVVIITTPHRTPLSYVLAIGIAENVLGMVPKGTHDWRKFITPQELQLMFHSAGMDMTLMAGMSYWPFTSRWTLTDPMAGSAVSYAATFSRAAGSSTT
jgi:2-polyprenyl-6-hydroxyphenyl methylase / 3-demethylubiquinone-9 3-methyltransferase